MRFKNRLLKIVVAVLLAVPVTAAAQSSSLNNFSPYSFYGLGDMMIPGNTALRSMGGAGAAFRSPVMINYLNPASYSAIPQKSMLLSLGAEGQNYYLKDANTKSSFNTLNVRDISLQFPFAKKLGFGLTITPYSSVGYRVSTVEERNDVGADIGYVKYTYGGSGGVTQFKAGLGYSFGDFLSIGAEAVYYHGNIERNFAQLILPITSSGSYLGTYSDNFEQINTFLGNFGIQSDIIARPETRLTLGATYMMGGKARGKKTTRIPFSPDSDTSEDIVSTTTDIGITLPHIFTGGFYLYRPKWSIGGDYSYSTWGNNNAPDPANNIRYRDTHTIKFGGQYVPSPNDARSFMKRWSYRAGFRYENYYMVINGQNINDKAFTLGFGIPLTRRGYNTIDVGLEVGSRGSTRNGLIKENYFKVSVSLNLFGDDYWFVKYKYD